MPANIDYTYTGNATSGLATVDYSGVTTAGEGIDRLLAVIPNPDAALNGSGAKQGGTGGGNLDEMSPGAAAQIRAELTALKAVITAFDPD